MLIIKPEDIDSNMTNVNIKAVINVFQVMAKKMIDAGKNGCFVNILSVVAKRASLTPQICFYAFTKAALEMLTKIMAIILDPYKIKVNALFPGIVETDLLTQGLQKMEEYGEERASNFRTMLEQTPSGQMLMPMDDVVNIILFMASNSATQITRQCFGVDGGLSVV